MAYQTNPTFSDGNVLSASQLNILGDNIAFLHSIVSGVNQPFTGQTMTGSGDSRSYTFRRQGRYLHFQCTNVTNDIDEFYIRIEGTREFSDASNHSGPYVYSDVIDLTTTTAAPAVGDFYEVHAEIVFLSGPNELSIDYFIESDSATL